MALGVSRTYLSSLSHSHSRLAFPAVASSSRVCTPVVLLRSYASTATVVTGGNRRPATAHKTASAEHLSSASGPKAPVKSASRRHASAGGLNTQAGTKSTRPTATRAAKARVPEQKDQTQQEQMENLDNILTYSQVNPTMDVWGQKTPTLDVIIPCNILASRHRLNGLSGMWSQFWKNRQNDFKNMLSLISLAAYNAIPGVTTSNDRFLKKAWKWPIYAFGTKSVKPTSWLALTRTIALDTYRSLNTAVAKNDLKEIKRLATYDYLADLLTTQKKRGPNLTYVWRFHREVNPTQVVSLRVMEGHLGPEDPKFGNRLITQVLVKFDTEESLEIYDRQGKPLHEPAPGTPRESAGRVPAEKRRVVQYLVIEKRMWYDGPWVIREQVWETLPKKT